MIPIFLLLTQINVNKFGCVAVNKDILHVTVAKTNHITHCRKKNVMRNKNYNSILSVLSARGDSVAEWLIWNP